MNKKRMEKDLIKQMPYDCWGNILLHISDFSDYFSLMLSVKGLWEHVRNISPHFTRHIPHRFRRFPCHKQPQVLYISQIDSYWNKCECGSCVFCQLEDLENEYECIELDHLIFRISRFFPNLEKVSISLSRPTCSYDDTGGLSLSLDGDSDFPNLRYLKLEIENPGSCEVEIDGIFPNLRVLKMTRLKSVEDTGRYSLTDSTDAYTSRCDAGQVKLDCDFEKSFPNLEKLRLAGWTLSNEFKPTSKYIALQSTRHSSANKKEKLDYLKDYAEDNDILESLEKLETLETFKLIRTVFLYPRVPKSKNLRKVILQEIPISYFSRSFREIRGHLKLEEIWINTRNTSNVLGRNNENEDKFVLVFLPSLKLVNIVKLDWIVELSETPKLETIVANKVNGVEFKRVKESTNLQVLKFESTQMKNNLYASVAASKKLRVFEYSGNLFGGCYKPKFRPHFCGYQDLEVFDAVGGSYYSGVIANCPKLRKLILYCADWDMSMMTKEAFLGLDRLEELVITANSNDPNSALLNQILGRLNKKNDSESIAMKCKLHFRPVKIGSEEEEEEDEEDLFTKKAKLEMCSKQLRRIRSLGIATKDRGGWGFYGTDVGIVKLNGDLESILEDLVISICDSLAVKNFLKLRIIEIKQITLKVSSSSPDKAIFGVSNCSSLEVIKFGDIRIDYSKKEKEKKKKKKVQELLEILLEDLPSLKRVHFKKAFENEILECVHYTGNVFESFEVLHDPRLYIDEKMHGGWAWHERLSKMKITKIEHKKVFCEEKKMWKLVAVQSESKKE